MKTADRELQSADYRALRRSEWGLSTVRVILLYGVPALALIVVAMSGNLIAAPIWNSLVWLFPALLIVAGIVRLVRWRRHKRSRQATFWLPGLIFTVELIVLIMVNRYMYWFAYLFGNDNLGYHRAYHGLVGLGEFVLGLVIFAGATITYVVVWRGTAFKTTWATYVAAILSPLGLVVACGLSVIRTLGF